MVDHLDLPQDLPVPKDDGAAMHLMGHPLPAITPLPATSGESPVDLFLLSLEHPVLIFIYPRTGQPGVPVSKDWDAIPGARGCTPHLCSVRDAVEPLTQREPGLKIFGMSTQSTEYQKEVEQRLHLPFPILSDEKLDFSKKLELPTFDWEGQTLLKRMTLLLRGGQITRSEHRFDGLLTVLVAHASSSTQSTIRSTHQIKRPPVLCRC